MPPPGSRLALVAAALLAACAPRANDVTTTPGDAAPPPPPIDARADADANTDGAEARPPCVLGGTSTRAPATIACGQDATGRLVLAGDHVYWTLQRPGGGVARASLVGGGAQALAVTRSGAAGLVVAGAYAYFTLPAESEIRRVPLDGGPSELVVTLPFPIFLATDGRALFVTGGRDFAGAVTKVPLAAPRAITLMDGLSRPRGIVVTGGFVYWADTVDGTLVRTADRDDDAAVDGGVRAATRLAAGLKGPSDLAIRGAWAYLADQGGHLVRVPLDGGEPEPFVPDAHGRPYGVATDATSIYWTTLGDGGVWKAPLAGGAGVALAKGEVDAHFLAVGADVVFWGAWGDGGSIKRVAKY